MFTNRLQVGILKNKYQSPLTNILQYAIIILDIISVPFIAVCNIFRELKSTQRRTEHTRFIAAVFSIYYQQPFFTYFFYVILSEREPSMKYTYIKQHDATDCAAACLAMVCLHYKKETTITQLRDMMGTDLKGTNLIGLSKCADALGFVSQAIRVDRENFLTDFTLPCIANVITKEGLTHFVVVFKNLSSQAKIDATGFANWK